jgi:hypothetical protein
MDVAGAPLGAPDQPEYFAAAGGGELGEEFVVCGHVSNI